MKRIVVHIDRLVLRGIDAGDAAAVSAGVQAGVEAELQRLQGEAGAAAHLAAGCHLARISAGSVQLGANSTGSDTGHQIGQAIAGGIAGGERS
ncbi:MAG: hypothetical protein Q7J47_11665 [Azoarcus sp.]|nr:hypothetical protein [Azoarcus sp.]